MLHVYAAVANEEELHGQLVCFKFCPIIKRDFAVVLAAQHDSHDRQRTDELEKQHQQDQGSGSHSPNSSAYKVSGSCYGRRREVMLLRHTCTLSTTFEQTSQQCWA